jgi:hypothetical protein
MSAAAETEVSLVDPYHAEWRMLREHPHNVLLEGPVAATDAALRRLEPHIGEQPVWIGPHVPFDLPTSETRTLILRDADALSAGDQRRLLAWLGGRASRTLVISTAECSLFARVEDGRFDAALYYRLNVVLLRVGSRARPDRHVRMLTARLSEDGR